MRQQLRLPPPGVAGHMFDIDYLVEPGEEELDRALRRASSVLVPKRSMKISEWSKKIRLPSQTSPRGGLFVPRRHQVDLLDVQQEPGVNVIALMGVPRIGKTTIPLVAGSYYNTHEGDDVLFVEVSRESLRVYHDSMHRDLVLDIGDSLLGIRQVAVTILLESGLHAPEDILLAGAGLLHDAGTIAFDLDQYDVRYDEFDDLLVRKLLHDLEQLEVTIILGKREPDAGVDEDA